MGRVFLKVLSPDSVLFLQIAQLLGEHLKGDALNGAGQAVRKLSPAQHVRDALRGGG